jgi:tRNA threonylcarbamoyladenosine biosynthesis protein TsaE
MSLESKSLHLADAQATTALGGALGDALLALADDISQQGMAVGLMGDLGAGKTALVRALLRRAGVAGTIKSPTFALLEPYELSRLHFYHFDFYRFKAPEAFIERGFSEYFAPGAVCLVEWPERAGDYLPPLDLEVHLKVEGAGLRDDEPGRSARLAARTGIGQRCLDRLESRLP